MTITSTTFEVLDLDDPRAVEPSVADGGGALSHAAIAAREHGIPAVLGTGAGTTSLHDGQRVRVDGTRGLVLAIEAAES